jgi:plastocyanin
MIVMQKNHIQTRTTLVIVVSLVLLLNLVIFYEYHLQTAIAAKGHSKKKSTETTGVANTSTGSNSSTMNTIQLSAKEKNEVYTWSNSSNGAINPTLKFVANANSSIQIKNPTDTKHELVIDFNGKKIASSGDIAPDKSVQVAFNPNMTGTFGYHCQYHPTTMKGIINVVNSP